MTIAEKKNLNRLRKHSREWQFYSLFYTSELMEDTQEGLHEIHWW